MIKRSLEEIEKEIEETKKELENLHGTETEVYARIVGYYRSVKNWNKGKKDEYSGRKMFDVEGSLSDSVSKVKTEEKPAPVHASEYRASLSAENCVPEDEQYFELFTRKTCPNCPPVKEFMESLDIYGKNIDVDTEDGLSEAASKGVFASPTVILYSKDGNEIARGHNVTELKSIFEKVPVKDAVL